MKTTKLGFNFKPLQLHVTFAIVGSIPAMQDYNADTGEHTPDYSLTPLVIQPQISIIDKDEVLTSGSINSSLANIKWYEIVGGTETLISTSNTNYTITQTGNTAGQIKVNKNAQPKVPITLRFYAEYVDTRTSQVYAIQGTQLIRCANSSDVVRVELNAAAQSLYNPFVDGATQQVTATVYVGSSICDSDKYSLVWELLDSDGTYHTVGTSVMDYHVSIGESGAALVNRKLMGNGIFLRCRVKYSAEGDPDDVELSDATPWAMCSFVRRLPKYEEDLILVDEVPSGTPTIYPELVFKITNGIITDADKELLVLWYMATNTSNGSPTSYSLVATGLTPEISAATMSELYGALLKYEPVDRGYWGAWEDSDGKILCDSDGKILLIK